MTDKELMRRFKAETLGCLVMAVLLAGAWGIAGQDGDLVKAAVPNEIKKETHVQKLYTDSVDTVNMVKNNALKSRSR